MASSHCQRRRAEETTWCWWKGSGHFCLWRFSTTAMHFDCFTLFSVRRRLIASSQMLEWDFPSRPAVSRLICFWNKSFCFLKAYHCPNAAHEQLLCCWGSIVWETEATPPLFHSFKVFMPLLHIFALLCFITFCCSSLHFASCHLTSVCGSQLITGQLVSIDNVLRSDSSNLETSTVWIWCSVHTLSDVNCTFRKKEEFLKQSFLY